MESENITLRRKNAFLRKSCESLQNYNLSSSFNSDMAKSLPDLSTHDMGENEELKNKIKDLEIKLNSAHNEIDKLLLENTKLNNQLSNRDLRIKELLHICSSSSRQDDKRDSIRKKALSAIKRKINFGDKENCDTTPTRNLSLDDILTTLTSKTQVTIREISSAEITEKSNIADTKITGAHTHRSKEKNIYIFGGQTCSGLGLALYNSRSNTKYEKYTVSCFTKPEASTKEILRSCTSLILKNDDKLVLSVGENDINPISLTSELYNVLELFKNNNIIVLSVTRNSHLNTEMLNNQLKLLCSQYKNCNFIDINNNKNYQLRNNYHRNLCYKINLAIDYFDYKKKYLTFTNKQMRLVHNNCKPDTPKKGTIPYYFKKQINQNKSPNLQQEILPQLPKCSSSINGAVKGTIPYYFKTIIKKTNTLEITRTNTTQSQPKPQLFRSSYKK